MTPESIIDSSDALNRYLHARNTMPPALESGTYSTTLSGRNTIVRWMIVRPQTLWSYSGENGKAHLERIPDNCLDQYARILEYQRLIRTVLTDVREDGTGVEMSVVATHHVTHECVLGSAYEAGVSESAVLRAGNLAIPLPGTSARIRIGMSTEHADGYSKVDIFSGPLPVVPEARDRSMEMIMILARASRFALPAVARRASQILFHADWESSSHATCDLHQHAVSVERILE